MPLHNAFLVILAVLCLFGFLQFESMYLSCVSECYNFEPVSEHQDPIIQKHFSNVRTVAVNSVVSRVLYPTDYTVFSGECHAHVCTWVSDLSLILYFICRLFFVI